MEKILLALDVARFNNNVLDFACYLASITNSKLTGIFLGALQEDELPVRKSLMSNPHIETLVAGDITEDPKRRQLCDDTTKLFKNTCQNNGVCYSIHRNQGVPEDEIIAETRFSDLLIVDAEMSFEERKESTPTRFVKEVVKKSECPIVITPFSYSAIDEVLLAYDGSSSSVFAIKQFAYLFPEFKEKRLTILQVDDGNDLPIVNKDRIAELLESHYSTIRFEILHGKPADEIFGYLLQKENMFVIMGAFSRKILGNLFKDSTAELILKAVNLPVFIAHR